jgi:hypothetical protein
MRLHRLPKTTNSGTHLRARRRVRHPGAPGCNLARFDVRVDPQLVLEASGVAVPEDASLEASKPNDAPASTPKNDK